MAVFQSFTLEARYRLLGAALVLPALLVFLAVVAYPLCYSIVLGFFQIYTPTLSGPYVGLDNYIEILTSTTFWQALWANVVWTAGTLILQVNLGIAIALMLHQNLWFRPLARSLILFPYMLSTVVAVLVWQWMFNDLYGVLNHLLMAIGVLTVPIDWLGTMPNAMISIILVGTWKFFPFVVITVLARLQTIPEQLYEAAKIDGAGPLARFVDVTLPQLRSVLFIVVLLRAIWDFKEFDLIFLMTGGGPVDATTTLPLLVYKQAFPLFQMGRAAAIAVCMLLLMLGFMTLYFRRYAASNEEG